MDAWFNPLLDFLVNGAFLEDKKKAYATVSKLRIYFLQENKLYRKTSLGLGLLYITKISSHNLLKKVHEGYYRSYFGGRKLSQRIVCQGFYWLNILADSIKYSQMFNPWPFYKWGLDIIGPMPLEADQKKFMLVAIDYFTKWVEAKALSRI